MKRYVPLFWLAGRIFLGGVFAYSGFSKLMEPAENFRGIIAQYEVIPYVFLPVIAAVFPWLEFLLGSFLILGYAPRWSALALSFFSLIFLIVLGSSKLLLGAMPVSCGCFGEGGIHLTVRQVFLLDLFDLVLGFGLFRAKDHVFSFDYLLKTKGVVS